MTGFSVDWLSLREPVDLRSRNRELGNALSARLALRERVRVIDLGCGTGANLRATAPLLPAEQDWVLLDNDPELLVAAVSHLTRWARAASQDGDRLHLDHDGRRIRVRFATADLARDLETCLADGADLVTASALLDLVSEAFIKRLAAAIAGFRPVFHTVLTYNGIQRFTPRHPLDNQMIGAFHRHQRTDKGFGPAAGPTAQSVLSDQLRMAGFGVQEGDSPWRLGPADAALMAELTRGFAQAVSETGSVDERDIEKWLGWSRMTVEVGHTDTLAVPE